MFDAYRNGARELDALPSKLTDDERRDLKHRISALAHSIGKLALQATLRDMALEYARKQVLELRWRVRDKRILVRHYDRRRQWDYEDVWKDDHLQAKRELALCKKKLALWKQRLAAMKALE